MQGDIIATGDSTQTVHSNHLTAKLAFAFKDGSAYEETAVYTQRHIFRLLHYHLVTKGPSFPHPLEMDLDAIHRNCSVHYTEDGKPQDKTERLKPQPNLANGFIPTLLDNISPQTADTKLSMAVATPKPRLVTLAVSSAGDDDFAVAGRKVKATHFVLKVDIGGVAGAVAPLIGKQPPDIHVWIAHAEVPTFLRWQGPFFADGPIWIIDLATPELPKSSAHP